MKIFKNKFFIFSLCILFILLLGFGVSLLLGEESATNLNDSETLIFEPSDDCVVPEDACEQMGLLTSCPEQSICEEMLVGWDSGDLGCPTYSIRCFQNVE